MTELAIRDATEADLATVVAFNQRMAEETEGRRLRDDRIGAGVAAVLGDPSKGFYLIAERGGHVVGQLMVTYEWSDWRNGTFFWIQSVYVPPEARRTGVYRALYDAVNARAAARGDVCGVRLYVERDNDIARKTYEALGMRHAVYDMYETEHG
jgi:ribosomal protein S18 acetylase RimI-like enzyme